MPSSLDVCTDATRGRTIRTEPPCNMLAYIKRRVPAKPIPVQQQSRR